MGFRFCTIFLAIIVASWSPALGAETVTFQCLRGDSPKCIIPTIIITDNTDEVILPNLSNKTMLQIKSGNISNFGKTIGSQLGNVEVLHLGMLGIKELQLKPQLTEVSAENNEISLIDLGSGEGYKTKVLHLAKNRLSNLDGFEKLVHLVDLNLMGNLLKEINLKTFESMTSLKTLNLADNQLTTILADSKIALPELDFLSLSGNKLQKLDVLYWDFESLTTLDVSSNQLIEIASIEDHFPSLSYISLAGNSWYCMWLEELLANFTKNFVVVKDRDRDCEGMSPSNICCIAELDTNSSYDESFQKLDELEKKQSKLELNLQTKIQDFESSQNRKLNEVKTRLEELMSTDLSEIPTTASDITDKAGFAQLKGKVENLLLTVEDEVAKFEKRNKENSDAQRRLGFAIVDLKRALGGGKRGRCKNFNSNSPC
ncbi:uncharacterized protein LOC129726156 [Wyeomyia smithii]|uniref:uncharacterized protein LOC129726156 n=1 Tax=Wyeomyia smithii TaxID=174621 RepID=UPI002467C135|nr:uncharacterized protein LOC129726156 [Wyeomyia smithii]